MVTARKSAETFFRKAKGKEREKARAIIALLSQLEQEQGDPQQHVGSRPEPEHRKGNPIRQPKAPLTSKPQGSTGGKRFVQLLCKAARTSPADFKS